MQGLPTFGTVAGTKNWPGECWHQLNARREKATYKATLQMSEAWPYQQQGLYHVTPTCYEMHIIANALGIPRIVVFKVAQCSKPQVQPC